MEQHSLESKVMIILDGEIYPDLSNDILGNFALESIQVLATNLKGIKVPLSGFWIPEEQPQSL
jgi:hypothetical protein